MVEADSGRRGAAREDSDDVEVAALKKRRTREAAAQVYGFHGEGGRPGQKACAQCGLLEHSAGLDQKRGTKGSEASKVLAASIEKKPRCLEADGHDFSNET